MRLSAFWRRSSSTAAGVYVSALIGFLGSIVAFRELGTLDFGRLALVLAATGFFQLFADLTVEEAVVKYGFRYAAREDWGRFRRVGAVLSFYENGLKEAGFKITANVTGNVSTTSGGMLSGEDEANKRTIVLIVSMTLRLAAFAVGAAFGVLETVVALVAAQVLATAAISVVALAALRRFPSAPAVPLGEDRLPFRRFVIQSSLGSVLSPMRGLLGTLLLGAVTSVRQVSYFRIAQVPESAFASLSSPVRMILLSEQTHAFEQGRWDTVNRMLRRYVTGAALLMAVLLPPLLWLMPTLLRIAYGSKAEPASNAARLILLVAAGLAQGREIRLAS